ncbi:MAG: PAS domain S-box protein [Candidatus Ozemobacteraceae bacterium]
MIIIDFISNLTLLIAFSVLSGFIDQRWKKATLPGELLQGGLFGCAAILGMLRPVIVGPGLIFDGRSVMVSLCGLFFGFWATALASAMTILFRIWQGGAGMATGCLVIFTSALLGLLFRWRRFRSTKDLNSLDLFGFGLIVHVVMLADMFTLPSETAIAVFNRIAIPVLLTYPPATILVGKVLSDQDRHGRFVEALRQSEEHYRRIVDTANEGIWIVDENFETTFVNPHLTKMFDYQPEEMFGKKANFFMFESDLSDHKNQVIERQAGKKSRYERRFRRKDGSELWTIVSATPIMDSQTSLFVGSLGMLVDISERKQAEIERQKLEQEFQQTQKLESLGVLAGGIAHDFNNILMVILGNAELAMEFISPTSPTYENIVQISTAANRATELCRQMMTYSGKAPFVLERVSLRELLKEIIHLLKASISKKAVLNLHIENDLPSIQGDPSQIRQIAMNLIINASDAIGNQNGVITFSTGVMICDEEYLHRTELHENLPSGSYVYFEVADTGCGMDSETRKRIFEPFFSTKFTGRGLGLAAVLGIVRAHKGAISISTQPGKGTTFRVLFPAREMRPTEKSAVKSQPSSNLRGLGTILLVDDEETLRDLGKLILEKMGLKVLTAGNGREAVDLYLKWNKEINLVVLDLTMPHMDGVETFHELTRLNPNIRIIIASGYRGEDVASRFAGNPPSGFLQKPFSADNLRTQIVGLIPTQKE